MNASSPTALSGPLLASLAQDAIVFLGGRPEDLIRFLKMSGVGPDELRTLIDEPAFQAGLVEYFSQNEPLLLAFCEETGTDPSLFGKFRMDQ